MLGDLEKDGYVVVKNAIDKSNIDSFMKNRQSGSNEAFIERIDLQHEEVSYTIGENRKFDDFYFPDGKVVTAQRFSTFSFAEDDVAENIPQIDEIVKEYYPEIHKKGYYGQWNSNIYFHGDFICPHDDGIVPNRFCVFLVPMNTKPDRVFGLATGGGDLVLYPESHSRNCDFGNTSKFYNWDSDTEVPTCQVGIPIHSELGDVVILDFVDNNINHEITQINNWIRYSLVGFLFKK